MEINIRKYIIIYVDATWSLSINKIETYIIIYIDATWSLKRIQNIKS